MVMLTNRTGGIHLYSIMAESWGTGFSGLFNSDKGTGVYFNKKADKFQYGPLDPSFKDMITYLNMLFSEKLLDQEYALQSSKQWEEKLTTGKAFMTFDWISRVKWSNDILYKANKTDRFVGILPPKGPNGVRGIVGRDNHVPNEGMAVNAKVKDPASVVKFVDWLYSPEGRIACNYGIEGTTFTRNSDGTFTWKPEIKDSKNSAYTKELNKDFGGQINALTRYEILGDLYNKFDYEEPYNNREGYSKKLYYNNNAVIARPPVLIFNKEQQDVRKDKETIIKDYVTAELDKFIMGARPLSDWDKFVEDIKKKGVEDVLKAYADAYATYKK